MNIILKRVTALIYWLQEITGTQLTGSEEITMLTTFVEETRGRENINELKQLMLDELIEMRKDEN